MRDWLAARSPRERLVLAAGLALLAILLIYALAWRPLALRISELERAIDHDRELLHWFERTAVEVAQLRARGEAAVRHDERSLLALVDQTARKAGLGRSIRRVEPNGKEGVRLRFEAVAFDTLMAWLGRLVDDAGGAIRIESLAIDRRDEPGLVDARLTLREKGTS